VAAIDLTRQRHSLLVARDYGYVKIRIIIKVMQKDAIHQLSVCLGFRHIVTRIRRVERIVFVLGNI